MAAVADHGHGIENQPLPTSGWLPNGGTVSQGFGVWEAIPSLGINAPHEGIDVAGHRGDPVTLPAGLHAVVQNAGWDPFGGGNFVQLALDDGSQVQLFHLQDIAVAAGQSLTGSQLLGHMDSTGASTGDHLHFQLNQGGKAVDPWGLLTAAGQAASGAVGGSLNPLDALKNVNDFFGHLVAPGHAPCQAPADEVGVLRVIDAVTCPQNWWKVAFTGIGLVVIGVGFIMYFFTEERAAAVRIVETAPAAAEAAA